MMNLISRIFGNNRTNTYMIHVVAVNNYTNETEEWDIDNIGFSNWAIGNMTCGDYEIISTQRI